MVSETFEVADFEAAIELLHARGCTDGLPVIPPTPQRLETFLAAAGRDGAETLGFYELRNRPVTVEKVAINAIMAGCLPEHLPVVLALVECLMAQPTELHVANASTGSLTLGFIVNGPVRRALGMNSQGNVLGPGNRANASIGRALRLVQINVMGSLAGAGSDPAPGIPVLDRSTMGHPAKYTAYHVVEDEEAFPQLTPLHVGLGFDPGDSVVTAFTMGSHLMLSSHFEKTPDEWVDTCAHYLVGAGRLAPGGFGVLLVPPEAAAMFVGAGWSKRDISTALFERTRRSTAWVKRNGWKIGGRYERGGAVQPGDEDAVLGVASSPDDLHVVVCGGPAGNFPVFLQTYADAFKIVSRRVAHGRAYGRDALDIPAADAALSSLRSMLQSDGYGLDVVRAGADGVVLQLSAGPEACPDCLVPPSMMETYVRQAIENLPLGRKVPIELRYPAAASGPTA